ncbi:hypothetical protein D3C72_455460 [compost metagenome]
MAVVRQRIEGPHHIGVFGHGRRRHLAGGHGLEGLTRRRDVGRRAGLFAAGQHLAVAVQDIEGRIAEEVADLGQGPRELDAVVKQPAHAAQFGGHGLQIHLQPRADVGDIGPADLGAVLDRRADIGAEPLIHAPIDQKAKDKRDQNRRNDRHQRKQGDETKMQARARIVSVPHQTHHSHADDRSQAANQHQIGQEDEQNELAGRGTGVSARRRTRRDGHQPDRRRCNQKGDSVGRHEKGPGATAGQTPPERALGVVTFSSLRGGEVRHYLAASTSCGRFSTPELLN